MDKSELVTYLRQHILKIDPSVTSVTRVADSDQISKFGNVAADPTKPPKDSHR